MASIQGAAFNITGASGSQSALTAKSGWFAYIFPRGAWADQDSSGTLITFGSSAQASRFAANDWIQVGTATANLRKVSAVGGNSISVSGAAVTVTEDNRVFLIGQTQPSTSGGSTTYTIPATAVRHRDDDASDRYTNSLITSNSDGLIQFYAPYGIYDVLIQDGNQSPQGYIADLAIGVAEGVSTSFVAVFGATVTVNAAFGVTGWATFGQTVTMNANAGVTGTMTFGSTATFHAAIGVTGTAVFGATLTANAAFGVTGSMTVGASGVINGLSVTTGIFGVSNQPRAMVTIPGGAATGQSFPSGSLTIVQWSGEVFDVGGFFDITGSSTRLIVPAGCAGAYLITGQITWGGLVTGGTGSRQLYILKNGSAIAHVTSSVSDDVNGIAQTISTLDQAAVAAYYELEGNQTQGSTLTMASVGRDFHQFSIIKLA